MLHPHSLYYDHLKPAELDFLKKVADFCEKEIASHATEWEKEELPRDLFTEAGRVGLMGVMTPAGVGGQGLGLGLAITRTITRLHRGSLSLEPRPDGPGLRAIIELPLAE